MIRRDLTERQAWALCWIIDAIAQHAHAPTIREIGDAMGIRSTNAVIDTLKAMEKKGWLQRGAKGRSRVMLPLGDPRGDPCSGCRARAGPHAQLGSVRLCVSCVERCVAQLCPAVPTESQMTG